MKRKLYFLCLIASLSSVALAQVNSVQDELKTVPENRIFISHSQESRTFPLYLETGEATGECGIGVKRQIQVPHKRQEFGPRG